MNTRIPSLSDTRRASILAHFGPARLVELPDGHLELRGGGAAQLVEAKEWLSLFQHDRVLRFVPSPESRN